MSTASDPPLLILLPGFDGTGDLFERLIRELGPEWPVRIVRYRDERTFGDYVDAAAKQLPERDAVLVAESFSGPVALALLAKYGPRIRAAVLCDMRATCRRVHRPVLILQGARDKLLGRRQLELQALLPGATVFELNGPHLLLQAEPRGCADAIKRFLLAKVKG